MRNENFALIVPHRRHNLLQILLKVTGVSVIIGETSSGVPRFYYMNIIAKFQTKYSFITFHNQEPYKYVLFTYIFFSQILTHIFTENFQNGHIARKYFFAKTVKAKAEFIHKCHCISKPKVK